jgi:hypothetical protein
MAAAWLLKVSVFFSIGSELGTAAEQHTAGEPPGSSKHAIVTVILKKKGSSDMFVLTVRYFSTTLYFSKLHLHLDGHSNLQLLAIYTDAYIGGA